MKNWLILLFSLIQLSCGKENLVCLSLLEEKMHKSQIITDGRISYPQAISIAQQAPSRFGGDFTKNVTKTVLHGLPIITESVATKSGNVEIDTLLFVFNYAEGGYVVIPTIDIESDIIAYVEEGKFNIQDTASNELSRCLVSLMIAYQKNSKDTYSVPEMKGYGRHNGSAIGPKCLDVIPKGGMNCEFGEPTSTLDIIGRKGDDYYKNYGCYLPVRYYDGAYTSSRSPMLTTLWGQGEPYYNQTPKIGEKNTKTGCVALAVSQIMVYHAYPVKYPSVVSLLLNIPSNLRSNANTNTALADLKRYAHIMSSPGARDYGSKFIAIIGYMLNNNWGIIETGAYDQDVPWVFTNMGYASSSPKGYNSADILYNLNKSQPVYISGVRDGNKGHAWVIDGYKAETRYIDDYIYFFDEYGNYNGRRLKAYNGSENTQSIYFHCNFGWSGDDNGYYFDRIFNTSDPHELTGASHNVGRHYRYDVTIIPNIKPL